VIHDIEHKGQMEIKGIREVRYQVDWGQSELMKKGDEG
jgi:hypothetical protein